jgi:thiamine-monophosphate kinase
LLCGLVTPGDTPVSWLVDLAQGMHAEARRAGAALVGGDTTEGPLVVLSVTALGQAPKTGPMLRSGASVGDHVAVCGRLGWAAAGLALLEAGYTDPPEVVEAHHRPRVDYSAGPRAARAGATALIDVSDGLLADLGHVAGASKVSIDVTSRALDLDEELLRAARKIRPAAELEGTVRQWQLIGGDDHALVATFPPDALLPKDFRKIGQVTQAESIGRVTVDSENVQGKRGFRHFQ